MHVIWARHRDAASQETRANAAAQAPPMSRASLPSSSPSSGKTENLCAGAELTNDVDPSPIPVTAGHVTTADTVTHAVLETPGKPEPQCATVPTRLKTTQPTTMPAPIATKTPTPATATPAAVTAKKHQLAEPDPAANTDNLDLLSCESSESEEDVLLQVPSSLGLKDGVQMRTADTPSLDDVPERSGARVRLSMSIIGDLSDGSDNEDSSGSNGDRIAMTALESKYVSKEQLDKFMQDAGLMN